MNYCYLKTLKIQKLWDSSPAHLWQMIYISHSVLIGPTAACSLRATPRIVPISKTDSGKSRWEWPGENEGNLRLHAHLGMVARDGERNSKMGREEQEHIKSRVGGNSVVCEAVCISPSPRSEILDILLCAWLRASLCYLPQSRLVTHRAVCVVVRSMARTSGMVREDGMCLRLHRE